MTWTEIKNAEYEVVQRLRRAAANIDADFIVIDNEGFKLWSNAGGKATSRQRIDQTDVDFVLSLHFESPKLYDVFSYTALWNPPEFYGTTDYGRVTSLLASHDAVVSCESEIADTHARNIFLGFNRPLESVLPRLFHSVPEPHFEPSISATSRLFYIGINWERVTGERGRHQDLLEILDAEDLVDIFGPELFLGKRPWAGFKCYKGEIPFDGESVVRRVSESGICLALSSDAHQRSGIMSNRLFEGLAAGAVIIANPHPFVERYLADCIYIVDDRKGPRALADEVRALVKQIRRQPDLAKMRAAVAQRRFKEMFTLEKGLRDLFVQHDLILEAKRVDRIASPLPEITVIVDYPGLEMSALLAMMEVVESQEGCCIDIVIVCDEIISRRLTPDLIAKHLGSARSVRSHSAPLSAAGAGDLNSDTYRTNPNGPVIGKALAEVSTPFFCFLQSDDYWFSEHLVSLARCLQREVGSVAASSGKIVEDKHEDGTSHRHFEELRFDRIVDFIHCALPREAGRFLYRKEVLVGARQPLILLLDGFHSRHLNLEAVLRSDLAQSGQATYVHRRWKMVEQLSFYTEIQQSQFVLDAYRGDPRWLTRSAEMPAALVSAASIVAARRSEAKAELGVLYDVLTEGSGIPFLRGGFSYPEKEFVWIDGRHARLELRVGYNLSQHDIILLLAARSASDGAKQVLTIDVNGHRCLKREVGEDAEELRISIPSSVSESARRISLAMTLRHAEQVRDNSGAILDPRRLGLRLMAVGVYPRSSAIAEAPTVLADELIGPPTSKWVSSDHLRAMAARLPAARRVRRALNQFRALRSR